MPGILFNGKTHLVPGLNILSPGDEPWVKMDALDYKARSHPCWIRQITIHTTKGTWPKPHGQLIRPGAGPAGYDEDVAAYWSVNPEGKRVAGGAHFVIGADGRIACLVDIGKYLTHHATRVNPWSIGIEMYQLADGSIYQATIDACVRLVMALCDLVGIPFQGDNRVYHENGIIKRMKFGGKDVVGVFGHRDSAWDFEHDTSSRGKGDPGEAIFIALRAAGMARFDIDAGEELAHHKKTQRWFNEHLGEHLDVDGLCGPSMVAALRRHDRWNHGVISALEASC